MEGAENDLDQSEDGTGMVSVVHARQLMGDSAFDQTGMQPHDPRWRDDQDHPRYHDGVTAELHQLATRFSRVGIEEADAGTHLADEK